nr:transposon Ty3-I Gag-Pol polyprotein [Tanacetum cinerariifolium]
MYHDLKQHFSWSGMKRDVAMFVSKCLICQQVKIEHQRASGLLQQLDIPVWKWDEISMDFVTGLPRTQRRYDAIWVVVDHLIPLQRLYQTETHVSRLIFGKVCRRLGEPALSSVLPFIPRQTVREKGRQGGDQGACKVFGCLLGNVIEVLEENSTNESGCEMTVINRDDRYWHIMPGDYFFDVQPCKAIDNDPDGVMSI